MAPVYSQPTLASNEPGSGNHLTLAGHAYRYPVPYQFCGKTGWCRLLIDYKKIAFGFEPKLRILISHQISSSLEWHLQSTYPIQPSLENDKLEKHDLFGPVDDGLWREPRTQQRTIATEYRLYPRG